MKQSLSAALVLSLALMIGGSVYADEDDEDSLVNRGYAISPIPKADLKFHREDRDMVGLGSFIVNAMGDCSGCHSFPQFLEKGNPAGSNPAADDPFEGLPSSGRAGQQPLAANFNLSHYLAGGQCFGPFMARNLTPEERAALVIYVRQQTDLLEDVRLQMLGLVDDDDCVCLDRGERAEKRMQRLDQFVTVGLRELCPILRDDAEVLQHLLEEVVAFE